MKCVTATTIKTQKTEIKIVLSKTFSIVTKLKTLNK